MSDNESVAQYDSPADAGKPPKGIVTRWLKEIELSGRSESQWRKQAKAVLRRFRDEAQLEKGAQKSRKLGVKFNILRPNTRVMKAAIYQDPPKPDVRRRFKDKDPLGKAVSEVTERALAYCCDKYDLDGALQLAIDDMLKPGRGVTRVRYEPHIVPQSSPAAPAQQQATGNDAPADTQPMEQIAWEKVCPKHVNWEDFRRGPGRTWDEVPWVAFRWRLTREEAIEKLPKAKKLLQTIDLDTSMDTTDEDEQAIKDNPALKDVFKRLTVWEVWDKNKRQVLFVAPSHKDQPLDVQDDPLGLEDFFDIPRPLYAVEQSDTLEPLEDFRAYADQAKELDNITARIDGIVSQLKVRGIYNAVLKQMGDVMSADEGKLIPSEETAALINDGGLEKNIWLMPIDKIAGVLQYLYEHREQTKQIIYEITGLSDIMRGASKASETATAQSIKAQNGAMSIQDRRKSVKRYARDIVRLMAEVICEHFQVETLKAMTGADYPTEAEKQQIGMQLQQMQQQMAIAAAAAPQPVPGQEAGAPGPAAPAATQQPAAPPPELKAMQDRLAMPSWEQITQVMKSDQLRCYRIDVETDETAFGDQQAEQQAVTELLQGITTFIQGMAEPVMSGLIPPEFVKACLLIAVRRFRTGKEIEDAIEELGDQPVPPPPDPNAGKIEAQQKSDAAKLDFEKQKHQQSMAFEAQKHEQTMAQQSQQHEFAKQQHGDDMAMRERERQDAVMNADSERKSRETIAQAKKPSTVLIDKEGKASDIAEGTAGVAAAVQQMTEALGRLLEMNAQAEQRQAQAITGMGQQIGSALIAALNTPKEVRRGKDGKIKAVVPVMNETRM